MKNLGEIDKALESLNQMKKTPVFKDLHPAGREHLLEFIAPAKKLLEDLKSELEEGGS